jgi:hypothetical protein
MGALRGSLAKAELMKECVPVILSTNFVWINLIKGGRERRNNLE